MKTRSSNSSVALPVRSSFRGELLQILTKTRFALVLLITAVAQGSEPNLPTIFVPPISGSPNLQSWRASIGASIADVLINQLASSPKFGVLETSALDNLRKEIEIGKDGWTEPSERIMKGHWFGADYMLAGKLTHFERPAKATGKEVLSVIPGLDLFNKKARVQILWRLVDTSTRKIVASGSADSSESREKTKLVNIAKGILGDDDTDAAMERALNVVLTKIITEIERLNVGQVERSGVIANRPTLDTPAKKSTAGIVEAVKPDFMIVAMGTKHGCKPGDKLDLFEVIGVQNAEGKIVFNDEKIVGEVEVATCIEERSKVRYSSLIAPKEGWIVRCKAQSGQ